MSLFYIMQRIIALDVVHYENLQTESVTVWLFCEWRQCRSHLRSFFARYFDFTDYKKQMYDFRLDSQWRNVHTKFHLNLFSGFRV
jgi:hypothetical protein